jgi:hypothetical protein
LQFLYGKISFIAESRTYRVKTMSVTLELKPEVEARAIEQAASRGVPVEDYLESVIEESLNGGVDQISYQTLEGWEAALDEFANSPVPEMRTALLTIAVRVSTRIKDSSYDHHNCLTAGR